MEISVRRNTCNAEIGEVTIDIGTSKITCDYDREDFAHELVYAYRDLYMNDDKWIEHLCLYLTEQEATDILDKLKRV